MNYVAPEFKLDAFHCPICGTYAHMEWHNLVYWSNGSSTNTEHYYAVCYHCRKPSLWRQYIRDGEHHGSMVEPDTGSSPLPDPAMPEDVKNDYIEASQIFQKSPRGAAALLRLGLQKLCKHLGENGKNINDDIRELAKKNTLPPDVIKVADTIRITGNNAVHPGEMSDKDFDYIASKMFYLINFIVKKGISEPLELKSLYEMTPEEPRKAAEKKDAAAQGGGA